MNQYEKAAIFVIRLGSAFAGLYGLLLIFGLIIGIFFNNFFGSLWFFSFNMIFAPIQFQSIIYWLALGVGGFVLSKPLGRLIGRDL